MATDLETARQDLIDRRVRHLGIEVVDPIAAFRIESDLLQRIRARTIHFDDDGAVVGIGAQDAPHEHGLGEILLPQL